MPSAISSGNRRGRMLIKHFMRYKPGWWVLHIITVSLTFYFGHIVRFYF